MASINLSGILTRPDGEPDVGAVVRFTHYTTTGNTVKYSYNELIIPPDGLYNIDIEYGQIRIDYESDYRTERFIAFVVVNQDSTATSIPELLNASVPPTDEQLLEFQSILADTVSARDETIAVSVSLKQVDTFAELEALSPSEDGLTPKRYICVERANAEYLLQPSGYVALAGDVTFANGRVAALQESPVMSVLNFGVYDGVDIAPLIQVAANSGRAIEYTLTGNYIALTKCDINTGDVKLNFTGAEFDCTNLEYDKENNGGGSFVQFRSGNPQTTSVTSSSVTAGQLTIDVSDATSIDVGNYIRVYSDEIVYSASGTNSNSIHISQVVKVSGSTVTLEHPFILDWDVATYPATVEYLQMIENCSVVGGRYIGGGATESPLKNGRGQQAVFFYGVKNIAFTDAYINNMFACAVSTERCIIGELSRLKIIGRGVDVVVVEAVNSSWYGVYPIRSRDIDCAFLTGERVRHLADSAQSINISQRHSSSTGSHRAAFGSHESVYNLTVSDCSTTDGYASVEVRAYSVTIARNNFKSETPIVTFVSGSGESAGRLTISNNENLESTGNNGVVALNATFKSVSITGNGLSSNSSRGIVFNAPDILCVTISFNKFFECSSAAIINTATSNEKINGLAVTNNEFYDYPTRAIDLYGSSKASSPADSIKISGNVFSSASGIQAVTLRAGSNYFGENVEITNNTQFNSDRALVSISGYNGFASHPYIDGNGESLKTSFVNKVIANSATSSMTSGTTVLRGSLVNRTTQTVGQPNRWVVTSSGTFGAITGVTGSIADSSDQLALSGNSSALVVAGSYINIAGAGSGGADLNVRISSINDDLTLATISSVALTTVIGAAVTRTQPVLSVVSTVS